MSEFADYVEKQQKLRYPPGGSTATTVVEEHSELDILDSLDLADASPAVRLKELLLNHDEDTFTKLVNLLAARIEEGHGETIFEIGFEVTDYSPG